MTTAVASARRSPAKKSTPSETWDEDFEFNRQDAGSGSHHFNKENARESPQKTHRRGISYDNDRDKLRWNASCGDEMLQDWPEPGPSRAFIKIPVTPMSAASSPRKQLNLRVRAEDGDDDNWDDDFVDKLDSPVRTHPRTPRNPHKGSPRYNARARRRGASTPPNEPTENWDEDFEMGSAVGGSVQASPASKRSRDASETGTNWDYSSDEGEESDFGREITYEEDKTVTARRRPLTALPSLPMPPLEPPHAIDLNHIHIPDSNHVAPHPRSPTISVFSIPGTVTTASGRESVMFSSTAHLALRRTHSAGSSSMGFGHGPRAAGPNLLRRYPAAQPVPRERRRLRKKSRPPRLESDVMELEDRFETQNPTGRPSTSSSTDGGAGLWRPQTPPPRSSMSAAISPVSMAAGSTSPSSTAARGAEANIVHISGRTPSGSGSAPAATTTVPPSSMDASASPVNPAQSNAVAALSNKSPLLSRIGSMKRWGVRRKRASGIVQSGEGGPSGLAPAAVISSSSASGRASEDIDEEENDRTPRASMNTTSSVMGVSPRGTPASGAGRFFRTAASGGGVDPLALKREASRDKLAATSTTTERGVGVLGSPTKARFKALGSRFMPGASKASTAPSSVVADAGDQSKDVDGDVTMTIKNIITARAQTRSSSPTPPSRRHSQLPPQLPSSLSQRAKAPRHFSGPASSNSRGQMYDGSGAATAPGESARGAVSAAEMLRTVSGAANSTSNGSASIGSAARDKMVGSASGDGHGKETKEKDGGRGFMGSVRRISIVGGGGQKKHKRSKSGNAESDAVPASNRDAAPPLPTPAQTPHTKIELFPAPPLLPPLELSPAFTSATKPVGVDLSSPVEPAFLSSLPNRSTIPRIPSTSNTFSTISPTSRRPSEPSLSHSKSSSFATPPSTRSSSGQFMSTNRVSPTVARLNSASPSQVNSLGRATQAPTGASGLGTVVREGSPVPRRNSLGDLKIPSRISKAQDGLKRDLTRVKEFATHVEQMKELRTAYFALIAQIQAVISSAPPPSRAATPLLHLTQPSSRSRSNTNPPPPQLEQRRMMIAFQTIDSKYRIAWECADLLIDLGTGAIGGESASPNKGVSSLPPVPTLTPPAGSSGAPPTLNTGQRGRAITLAGDEGKPAISGLHDSQMGPPQAIPTPPPSWRASTGRNDLNSRQLFLLKEMLNNGDSVKDSAKLDLQMYADEFSRAPTPWMGQFDGMESTVTLPTEESEVTSALTVAKKGEERTSVPLPKKRKGAKLGMTALRDMLRSLKRNQSRAAGVASDAQAAEVASTETSSIAPSNQSHTYSHPYGQTLPLTAGRLTGRKRSKTSIAPESMRATSGNDYTHSVPFLSGSSLSQPHKPSPRRPSLASLFRLGQKQKANGSASASSTDQSLDQIVAAAAKDQKEVLDAGADANRSHSTTSTTEDDDDESDWDRMDSTSDINVPIDASPNQDGGKTATLKGRNKRLLRRHLHDASSPVSSTGSASKNMFSAFGNTSQGSFRDSPDHSLSQFRSPRLSNVDENGVSNSHSGGQTPASPCVARELRVKAKEASSSSMNVRSSSAGGSKSEVDVQPIPDLKLAMTPENIKPLLENARVVTSQLTECISETKELLASGTDSKPLHQSSITTST